MPVLNRRQFTQMMAAAAAVPSSRYFYFAVIADTHIIDGFYKGPENSPLDTESIFKTTDRLTAARNFINGLNPPMEKVFLVGDYFHNYPSADWDFYFQNKTRVDKAKEITDGFKMPVHIGFGNHDYDVPRISRQFSHDLFRDKYGVKPYYSVDYKGYKFVHLNNFLGDTWNPQSKLFNKATGSLGEEQLNWFEAEMAQRKPHFCVYSFSFDVGFRMRKSVIMVCIPFFASIRIPFSVWFPAIGINGMTLLVLSGRLIT